MDKCLRHPLDRDPEWHMIKDVIIYQTMDREPNPKPDDEFVPDGAPEAADDDFSDIDPADFCDPEEFGIN